MKVNYKGVEMTEIPISKDKLDLRSFNGVLFKSNGKSVRVSKCNRFKLVKVSNSEYVIVDTYIESED